MTFVNANLLNLVRLDVRNNEKLLSIIGLSDLPSLATLYVNNQKLLRHVGNLPDALSSLYIQQNQALVSLASLNIHASRLSRVSITNNANLEEIGPHHLLTT